MTTFEEAMRAPFGQPSAAHQRARVFGYEALTESTPSWRTGPPGKLTEVEHAEASRVAFAPEDTHQRWQDNQRLRAKVAETRRQVALEQATLKLAAERGWDWLKGNTDGQEATIVESVRQRLGTGSTAQLQEAAGAALLDAGVRRRITEATRVQPTKVSGRRIRVTLITPGVGSSGLYTPEVLEQAARDRVFPAGTQMFTDHPSVSEARERPERSVRDLAAVLATDARWTGSALVSEADVLPTHAELVTALEGVAGVSIRAVGEMEPAQVDGRRVTRITKLVSAESVDFVTKAGRGGTYEVLESARWGW